jgi:thioredoxin reductase (NADPH)
MKKERVVIIGSGPAGMAAALYTARADLKPVVIVGNQLGGQVSLTHEIENYPGYLHLGGAELVDKMKEHSEAFGAQYVFDMVTDVDFSKGSPFTVKTLQETYLADSVIVTIGADPRKLNIKGEAEYTGTGVSYCGTCDGFFFRGKEIVVVGGGDSAIEEALFLTRFATKVEVIHRRDTLRAGVALQKRAMANPKLSFIWNSEVKEIHANEKNIVNAVTLYNNQTGDLSLKPTQGVFIFIGHDPNSKVFADQIAMNENGFVITDERFRTNVDGVFAAGEIQDEIWKQVATSAGQGVSAAMSTIHWLEEHSDSLQELDTIAEAGD